MSFHIFCYGIFTTVMLVSCASDMKHRSRIDIISQILEAANGGNATKTKIMYKTFLSYDQLKDGLTVLTEKDLLRYDENTPTFKITEKGRKFLQIYHRIDDMIKEEQRQPSEQQLWIYR